MKNILVTIAFLITTITFSQSEITKNIGEFSELKVYDLIEVELIKSNKNEAVITGRNKNDVVILNKNGKLKIRMNLEESFDGDNTNVKLYYTSIDIIDANEGAKIRSNDKIKQYEIELRAQEGGEINLELKVTTADIKSVTGGVIQTSGKAQSQDISISTGGVYKGKDLKTESTEIAIRAGGEADVNATDILDIKIRAGGDVFVYGDPKTVNKSKALGGRIKHMD
ncbi:DUF2807 domain-containing protein [Flavobacteriaceae bacterium S0825]|uniref:head GIN domain-containing protein n=1 Tax=Gaetbulibacter sp. S0825 TaxID=2720084 RepID=UPI001431750B|nr:head GIN domain-containing protein [Gaetbulibacter sp. S0825]MCK0108252.1 DUF2807 domain-containing protein [Flavobacteriaceae bacterium S0825]NIX63888.1 DUF2807 domain-containing protein [Gaetbulibacter sp. S0825]